LDSTKVPNGMEIVRVKMSAHFSRGKSQIAASRELVQLGWLNWDEHHSNPLKIGCSWESSAIAPAFALDDSPRRLLSVVTPSSLSESRA
jgi:hypothetical protein